MTPPGGTRPLRFGHGNAKLDPAVFTFSLPAGFTCPGARDCLSKADPNSGTIKDGPHTRFRCYSATMEARHPTVRKARWSNLKALRRSPDMARLILDSLSPWAGLVRVHDSGDFFSLPYLDAWLAVARQRDRTTFYWYTKAARLWLARLDLVGTGHAPGAIPNVVPTYSLGGKEDHLALEHRLRTARVVYSPEEALDLGLTIDHDDTHAMRHGPSFALLIHGTQPKGSQAAEVMKNLRDRLGFTGYGPGRKSLPLAVVP